MEKHGGGCKNVSPRDRGPLESRRRLLLDTTKESEQRKEDHDVARIRQGALRRIRPSVRDVKCEFFPRGHIEFIRDGQF